MDGPPFEQAPFELTPLAGGFSGETFVGAYAGERAVVRIYGPRSAGRGVDAPDIDAAVLELVRGLLPVPRVLEVRRGEPGHDLPGLLVTSFVPGERLDLLLPRLDAAGRRAVGERLGVLLGRLAHMVMPRAGVFTDPMLTIGPFPEAAADLPAWVAAHEERLGWSEEDVEALTGIADHAQDFLDADGRHCLVHSDLNPKNVLVDPDTLAVAALVDWEFAHAGSPWSDLGNLLRFDRDADFADGVVAAYRGFVPEPPEDLLDRARATDLFALVDLATRRGENPVADAAHDRLLAIARTGDLHAAPGWT